MNDDFITEVSDETGTDTDISVSGNSAEPVAEAALPDETETETTVEKNTETVSGNGVPVTGSATGSDSVSGNNVHVSFDDSGLLAKADTMTSEIVTLNERIVELHTTVIGISSLLTLFFGFIVFKWCEQKIKRFTKGVFNKYE